MRSGRVRPQNKGHPSFEDHSKISHTETNAAAMARVLGTDPLCSGAIAGRLWADGARAGAAIVSAVQRVDTRVYGGRTVAGALPVKEHQPARAGGGGFSHRQPCRVYLDGTVSLSGVTSCAFCGFATV